MKTKVCILQNGLSQGGTDTFVVNLCQGLDKERYDVMVVNPSSSGISIEREPDVLATGSIISHTTPFQGLKGRLVHLKMLYSILKKSKFDVFQTNIDLFNGPQLFVAWLAGVPVRCCHSHNGMQQKSIVQGMTWQIRLYQTVMKWMCWTFSNRRCGCSEVANDFLYEGREWSKATYPTVINNGIDLRKYQKEIDVETKKKELGLTNKYNIITIGRIIPQKNPIFIAVSISALLNKREDIDFIWVSDGPMRSECEEIFKKNGVLERVHFLGFRNDVDEILKCVDLFYMPSIFEGLPLVLVEAQASGVPCLIADSITQQANCGLIKYMSLEQPVDEWVKSLEAMIDKKITLQIEDERMHKFTIDYMVEQMEQVFALSNS